MKTSNLIMTMAIVAATAFNAFADVATGKIFKITDDSSYTFINWKESVSASEQTNVFEPIEHPVTSRTFYYETTRVGIIPVDMTYHEFLRISHEDKRAMLNNAQLDEYFSMFEACAENGLYIDSTSNYINDLIVMTGVDYPYKNSGVVKRDKRSRSTELEQHQKELAKMKKTRNRKRWGWKNTNNEPDYYWMEVTTSSGKTHQFKVGADSPYLSYLLEAYQSNNVKLLNAIIKQAGYMNYSAVGNEMISKL